MRDLFDLNKIMQFANGAIIGSAFVKALEGNEPLSQKISGFINSIATQS